MRQISYGDDDNANEQQKKNVTFVVATYSKRDPSFFFTNSNDVVFTEMEDLFAEMVILVGFHHMIITIVTYGWWSDWLGDHQREGRSVIY